MSRASHLVNVPAKASAVQGFLSENRPRFIEERNRVIRIISEKQQHDRRMSCIYKIYSRGDKPNEDDLKHPRKIRLKFDKYNIKEGKPQASLYDVPDIVGATVVVSYPSDINIVAEVLDELIDQGLLLVPNSMTAVVGTKENSGRIRSKHGRATEKGGYFACHYNLQMPGTGARPVCEIQIKTVLHDAWGAKTHDLTYKPGDKTDRDLLRSFELLGDVLANVDAQSDILRSSIERRAAVREAKRSAIQVESIRVSAAGAVTRAEQKELPHATSMRTIFERIETHDLYAETDLAEELYRELTKLFDVDHDLSCLLMCLLAVKSQRAEHGQNAQEAIKSWIEETTGDLDQIWARAVAALAAFGIGNTSEAIDNAEEAVTVLDRQVSDAMSPDERRRLARLGNSLFSSLAYYHADRIGSHEGDERNSTEQALKHLPRAKVYGLEVGVPSAGLDDAPEEIARVLADPEAGVRVFASLDSEAFVKIQTAQTEAELRDVRAKLQMLHDKKPAGMDPLASLLFDYHEYCARMRLAELEAS